MKNARELKFETILVAIDRLLGLKREETGCAAGLWSELEAMFDKLLEASRFDAGRCKRLTEITAHLKSIAAKLLQSVLNSKQGGPMGNDWRRFAERDLLELKDEALALREFLVAEADFFKFACMRFKIRRPGSIDPEKLFGELREGQAVSERTWVLLMSRPVKWRDACRESAVAEELARISGWFLDLQETRRARTSLTAGA